MKQSGADDRINYVKMLTKLLVSGRGVKKVHV